MLFDPVLGFEPIVGERISQRIKDRKDNQEEVLVTCGLTDSPYVSSQESRPKTPLPVPNKKLPAPAIRDPDKEPG